MEEIKLDHVAFWKAFVEGGYILQPIHARSRVMEFSHDMSNPRTWEHQQEEALWQYDSEGRIDDCHTVSDMEKVTIVDVDGWICLEIPSQYEKFQHYLVVTQKEIDPRVLLGTKRKVI